MAYTEGGATKEATILGLSEGINQTLAGLDAMLSNRFRRNRELDVETKEKPQEHNILDEIILNLTFGEKRLQDIKTFISSEVLTKIS